MACAIRRSHPGNTTGTKCVLIIEMLKDVKAVKATSKSHPSFKSDRHHPAKAAAGEKAAMAAVSREQCVTLRCTC